MTDHTNDDAGLPQAGDPVLIRSATDADRERLVLLAALDSSAAPAGRVLIAEVEGEARAAIEIATGRVIADPFRRTVELRELLELRVEGFRRAAGPSRRLRAARLVFRLAS